MRDDIPFPERLGIMKDFHRYNCFRPGKIWLDTEGKRIQAHGGSIMYLDGKYYWYGENKEFTDPDKGIWHWGVRCYVSSDLYNWDDIGLIIPPDLDNENSGLNPHSMMDRPHIIYNRRTKKFVCWMKIMQKNGEQTETVMTADSITGPYTLVREGLRPLNMDAGDFDLVVAPDGKAYYYFERVHSETVCADLTDDYTDVTGYYTTHFPHPYPPYVREATSHFIRNFKHYLVTSGTTGYLPNPSELAVAGTWHGPYKVLGDPHPGDASKTSYHSQISSVFKVPGKKDLYIALGDRWMPEAMNVPYSLYEKIFVTDFSGTATKEELAWSEEAKKQIPREKTKEADYVWLPFRFEGEMGYLDWKDEWRTEDYE